MSASNLPAGAAAPQAVVVIERTYRARIEELWALWTTKAGFESWWGPEGFRVEVHVIEAREGGAVEYDMIADAPEAIAAMKAMGQPLSHGTRGTYAVFRPHERLRLVHVIDFVPGCGRVGVWRAGVGRSLCSLLPRPFVCECHTISTMPRFQSPPRRTQHADFLALRSPVCFASRLMGPILPERLSAAVAEPCSR